MDQVRVCWGIYRERAHSPGRVDDDAAIMDAVAEALAERGFAVRLTHPDAADEVLAVEDANIFVMCERGAMLDRLKLAASRGATVINAPDAIGGTYRHRMIELFAAAGVGAPKSLVVATDAQTPLPAPKVWIKRYDFHATQPNDVAPASSEAEWTEGLQSFAKRGMPFVVVQEHVEGDLVKFYGVAGGGAEGAWFDWFYHRGQTLAGNPLDPVRLKEAALKGAAAVGLEIFGGDAIVTSSGDMKIIDINAWPSFALRRASASQAIADHLTQRFERRLPAVL